MKGLPLLPFALLLLNCVSLLSQTLSMKDRENLGPGINTAFDEVLPIISADGKILYFVRKDDPTNIQGTKDDIWYSELQADGTWGKAKNIGYPLNTPGFDYVCYALPDNNTLLLGNQYLADGSQRQGVSMSFRGKKGWQSPTNLNILNYQNTAKNAEFTMSPDANVLIMSIKDTTSLGDRDLYISFRMEDETWTQPKNLGAPVNSAQKDITPFLAADGVSLYFSSERPGGFGSNDVYLTRRLDSTWMHWSKPVNLGYPINTAGWDAYYTVPASGDYAYFVSTLGGYGSSDIFRIKLPSSVKPQPVLLVHGFVSSDSGHVAASIEYRRLSDNKILGTAISHPETGEFTVALPAGEKYALRAERDGYYPISNIVDVTQLSEYREESMDLRLTPLVTGQPIRMNNIFFDFDSANLRSESTAELERLVSFMKSHSSVHIRINGHTDLVGTEEYNLRLSQRRAEAVVDYLVAHGVVRDRLEARGFGMSQPLPATGDNVDGSRNRRVEFTIID